MKMHLDQILISGCDQTVSLKMVGDVVCDLILIQILVSPVNEELRVIAICKLVVFCID